jgi:hypothetical protein
MDQAALAVPLPLPRSVAFCRRLMSGPVLLLVIGMGLPPLVAAVSDDLGIFWISLDPAAVILGAALSLTRRAAADRLIRPIAGRFK